MLRNQNEGFSLVELVIVIAIMAILVAILAPQYIKYVEKSRLANDEQLVDAVHNAIAVALANENIVRKPIAGFTPPQVNIEDIETGTIYSTYPDFVNEIISFLQVDSLASLAPRLQSRFYKGQPILIEIDGNTQVVTVTVQSKDSTAFDDLVIK